MLVVDDTPVNLTVLRGLLKQTRVQVITADSGAQALDADEFLDVYTVPLADLVQDVMDGVITDAKTQVCILKAARLLL